jgi:hypothetical protein
MINDPLTFKARRAYRSTVRLESPSPRLSSPGWSATRVAIFICELTLAGLRVGVN